jgi:hypothetical protein
MALHLRSGPYRVKQCSRLAAAQQQMYCWSTPQHHACMQVSCLFVCNAGSVSSVKWCCMSAAPTADVLLEHLSASGLHAGELQFGLVARSVSSVRWCCISAALQQMYCRSTPQHHSCMQVSCSLV